MSIDLSRPLVSSMGQHDALDGLITYLFPQQQLLISQLADFSPHLPLMKKITMFWLTATNQQSNTWTEHIDINSIMLATTLGPDGYLMLR